MMSILSLVMFSFVCLLLFLFSSFFMENEWNETSEVSFECGFESYFLSRVPFSIHYFTVTVVFLMFDLEVVIFLPMVHMAYKMKLVVLLSLMIWLLFLGLVIEWFDKSLSWQF